PEQVHGAAGREGDDQRDRVRRPRLSARERRQERKRASDQEQAARNSAWHWREIGHRVLICSPPASIRRTTKRWLQLQIGGRSGKRHVFRCRSCYPHIVDRARRAGMIKTKGVLHITIPVSDPARSRAFYTDILGLDYVGQAPKGDH